MTEVVMFAEGNSICHTYKKDGYSLTTHVEPKDGSVMIDLLVQNPQGASQVICDVPHESAFKLVRLFNLDTQSAYQSVAEVKDAFLRAAEMEETQEEII